jgi:hypothetical protein
LSEELKVERQRKKRDLVVIPGAMTSQLQPLDVSVIQPFSDYLRKDARVGCYLKCSPYAIWKIKRWSALALAE